MTSSSELERRVAGLVGRTSECAVIDRVLYDAARGQSGSLVIRAGAGMGKTSLLRYAATRAVGMKILTVTGVEAESDLDYAGLHSLVRPIVEKLAGIPEPQRAAVAAALGLEPPGGADRFLVSAGVLSLLDAAAEQSPLLCLIDDAQWLDVPSADSLVFTTRRLDAEGIAILFAAREGERRRLTAQASKRCTSAASIARQRSCCSTAATESWATRSASGCWPTRRATPSR